MKVLHAVTDPLCSSDIWEPAGAVSGAVSQNKFGHQLAKLPMKAKKSRLLHCLKLIPHQLLPCLGKASQRA